MIKWDGSNRVERVPRWSLTASLPLKSYRNPIGKDRLPTTIFQGRAVKLQGYTSLTAPFNLFFPSTGRHLSTSTCNICYQGFGLRTPWHCHHLGHCPTKIEREVHVLGQSPKKLRELRKPPEKSMLGGSTASGFPIILSPFLGGRFFSKGTLPKNNASPPETWWLGNYLHFEARPIFRAKLALSFRGLRP